MQLYKNEVTGSVSITVDSFELGLLQKAVFDEQIFYYSLLRNRKFFSPEQEQEWDEKLQHLNNMAQTLGVGVVRRS